jgi:hypothetical protein
MGAIPLSDARLISHLYGFTPWIEASLNSMGNPTGTGCGATVNLLQDTPGYCVNRKPLDKNNIPPCPTVANPAGGDASLRNYNNYNIVKTSFDQLNYGPLANPALPSPGYTFNPWVQLIHADPKKPMTPPYGLNMPCSYAYSVDDAQGNVQAEGQGFILDISSTVNLENQKPCAAPINIALGYENGATPRFYKYAVCENTAARLKPIIPGFASFVISAQNPIACPVYVWDNTGDTDPAGPPKGTPYTFTILADSTTDPVNYLKNAFPFFENPADASWTDKTRAKVGCMGNTNPYSSRLWCCTKFTGGTGAGVFAFSTNVVAAHTSTAYDVITQPARPACNSPAACNAPISNFNPCNPPFPP